MMKKLLAAVAALAALVLAFTGCGSANAAGQAPGSAPLGQGEQGKKLSVVTTIFPQYDFVREIAGERVELVMLLPPGSECHSYEPSPQDIITIQNCDVFVYVGGALDAWAERILDTMDTSGMTMLALTEMVQTVDEEIVEGMEHDPAHDEEDHEDGHSHAEDEEHGDHDHEEGHTHEQTVDEHVWTAPQNAMAIVQALGGALCRLDAENAEYYAANTESYLADLRQLDEDFKKVVEEGRTRTIIVGDRFPFRYLADAYGLEYYAAFSGCSTSGSASAATVAFLIDKVKENNLPVVFHIEFSNQQMADLICEETGAVKRELHSCHNVSREDIAAGTSYLALMRKNVETLKEALA